jgi:hypothetical protein
VNVGVGAGGGVAYGDVEGYTASITTRAEA